VRRSDGRTAPLPPEEDRVAARLEAFAMTPAEHFPLSAAVAPTMAGYVSTEQFVWGLRRILDGLAPEVSAPDRRR
jgi:TetR/AcrR family transcriptional regulator, tetracycline repressor protein